MNAVFRFAVAMIALLPAPLLAAPKKPATAAAVQQQVIPPKTVYWMSAATQSGFGMGGKAPSSGEMMKMMMGGGSSGPTKLLNLDLGSKLPPAGPPAAQHGIPQGMNMGNALALKTPKPPVSTPSKPSAPTEPEDFQRPKGKLLLFWGCGETARPGQPVVIDFGKMAEGQIPPNLFSGERVRIVRAPSQSTWPTYGFWPNDDRGSKQSVPSGASLIGAHKVTGNYTPEINFTLSQDWMAGLDMKQTKLPSGALNLSWNAIPTATAGFAQLIGAGGGAGGDKADGTTIVFWSSSDVQTFISGLSEYIAPAEAARLVGKKQLMPPTQTSCAIPKEAMVAAPTGLISLVAHGPEENFVYPPRPSDPRTPWVQDWAVKARFVARTGGIAGMDMSAMGGGAKGKNGKPVCQPSGSSIAGEAVGGAIGGAIGGLFGKKKKTDCE